MEEMLEEEVANLFGPEDDDEIAAEEPRVVEVEDEPSAAVGLPSAVAKIPAILGPNSPVEHLRARLKELN
jgi:hypothetical protein